MEWCGCDGEQKYDFVINKLVSAVDAEFALLNNKIRMLELELQSQSQGQGQVQGHGGWVDSSEELRTEIGATEEVKSPEQAQARALSTTARAMLSKEDSSSESRSSEGLGDCAAEGAGRASSPTSSYGNMQQSHLASAAAHAPARGGSSRGTGGLSPAPPGTLSTANSEASQLSLLLQRGDGDAMAEVPLSPGGRSRSSVGSVRSVSGCSAMLPVPQQGEIEASSPASPAGDGGGGAGGSNRGHRGGMRGSSSLPPVVPPNLHGFL